MNIDVELDGLINGGLGLTRRDSAIALGRVTESNEKIVLELLVARETDRDNQVKEAAATALDALPHQSILKRKPDLVQIAIKLGEERQAKRINAQNFKINEEKTKNSLMRLGLFFIFSGIIAFILPYFGMVLLLFKFIPITHPVFAFIMAFVGVCMVLLEIYMKRVEAKKNIK